MIRTLIVEDDATVAEVNRGYLERIPGFSVMMSVTTGAAAVDVVARQQIDLVLLDFFLPDMRGLDVCRALRSASPPPVDIMAVTAARDAYTVRSAVAFGSCST
ncbi:MAG: response regulator [Sciscionella sp.]